ncbi:hypothetical protein AGMMS4952_07550 [Spirochaetia bacterium]|nr:hypothetical protein AGMMS4952_07550 [Spirochaetia bacterium]
MIAIPRILPKIPAILVVLAIWILSSQSTLPTPKGVLGFDKFQHLIAYLALAGTFAFWFSPVQRQSHRLRTFLLIVLASSLYGVIDEVHQLYVPGRNCNVQDWIADTLGAFLGAGAALLVEWWVVRKSK